MAVDPIAKIAHRMTELERQVKSLSTSYQLGRTSFSDGTALPDVILASNRAVESAAQAVKDASSALAKADGVVNTFYGDATPTNPGVGDFWVKGNGNAFIRGEVNGVPAWVPVTDPQLALALQAAKDAEAAADGKISTWFQASAPTGAGVGDIWYDTDDKNTPYRWNGTQWQPVRDGKVQDALDLAADASRDATAALNSANGRNRVVYSTGTPNANGTTTGDTWFRIDASGTVLDQYRWSGSAWVEVEPQSVVVASLDAGKITTGTLAAGVTITAGTPGGTRTEITNAGIRAYVGSNLRMSFTGSTSTVIADTFRSANFVNGGVSYVLVGDIGDGSAIDGIKIIRPGGSHVTLKNITDSGGGVFEVSFRDTSNINQGGWQFSTGNIQSMSPFWSLNSRIGGSGISGGSGASLSLNALGQQVFINGSNVYSSAQFQHTFNVSQNGSGMIIQAPPNQAYGATLIRNAYYGGGTIKLTQDGAIQSRDWNDYGYAAVRGIIQDQSNPDLKEHIVPLNVDALAEISGMGFYAYDWKREPLVPFVPPPADSSTGLLLSEVPNVVQQTGDGYATGSLLGLVVAAVNQLNRKVDELSG